MTKKVVHIWNVPLLVLAGLFAIAGVGLTFAVGAKEPWPAVEWALAGASLTFTVGRIVHARKVTRRELELIAVAGAVFVALYQGVVALGVTVGGVVWLAIDEAGKAKKEDTAKENQKAAS